MHEIKFRVWDLENRQFSYSEKFCTLIEPANIDFKLGLSLSNKRYKDCQGYDDFPIQQFSSLKDKNGKDIYEGDLISAQMNEKDGIQKGKVVFDRGCFVAQFHYIPCDEERSKNFEYRLSLINTECEVVGNIYENQSQKTP